MNTITIYTIITQHSKDDSFHNVQAKFLSFFHLQWAHFPRIHFGLNIDGNKQAKLDEPVSAPANTPGGQKGHSFCW